MAGTALAGKLTAERTSRVDFALADEGDDADIRRLLRENPMRGRIAVSLEREPSFFAEAKLSSPERNGRILPSIV